VPRLRRSRWLGCWRASTFIVPIFGSRRLDRVEENLATAHVTLSADDLAEIEQAQAKIEIHGTRYTAQLEATTGL